MLTRAVAPVALLLAVAASACSGGDGDDGFATTQVHKVASVKKITDFTEPISVSPTGTRIVYQGHGLLCVARLDGSQKHCTDKVRPDQNYLSWSPDGNRLAFTDDLMRALREPDLWVLDAENGSVRNLTDDGVRRVDLSRPAADGMQLDVFPTWAQDGGHIYFTRMPKLGEATMQVMSIPAAGGDPEQIGSFATHHPLDFTTVSSDGKHLAWTEGSGVETTTHTAEVSGSDAQQISGTDKADSSLLRFSADGRYLLMNNFQISFTGDGPPSHVLRFGNPEAVSLGRNSTGATWSPLGHTLIFLKESAPQTRTDPTGESHALPGAKGLGVPGGVPVWSAKNTVVYFQHGEPALLTLA